ncbi:MAG: hypothetical protein CL678_14615 [Bdellovibrionaceae bacterium]|nr:hypothetical protein [Pseudobdellovibrionaceae bacterium]
MWVTDAGVFFLGGIKIARPGSAIGVDAIFRCSKGIVLELDIEGFGSFTYDTYGSPKNNSRENVTITPTAAQNAWFDSLTAGTVVNVNLTITSYQSGNVINSIRPVEEIVVDYSGENLVAFTYFEDYEAYLDAFPKLEVYLSDTMERVRTINVGGNPAYTTSLSFSPDGTKLLASWYDTGSPTMVVLYDVATWVVLGVLDTTPLTQYAAVLMPVWTPDSQYVFIAAETKMGVFSGGDLSLVGSVFTLPAFYSTHDISPDQKNLVVATQSGAYIYNSDDFDVLVEGGTKPTLVQTGWVACVKYSPSGSYIGVYMSGSMRVHSAETGLQLATNGQFESLSNNRQDQVFYWVSDTEIRANARQPNSPYNPYIASLAFDGDSLTLSAWASTSTDINKVGAMSAADDFSYTLLSGYSSALLYDSEGNDITLSWMGTSGDVVMASNRFLAYTPPVAGSSPENLMIAIQYVDGWNNYGGTGRVVAVDMDTGDFHDTGIDLTGAPQAVCFSADGSRVAIVQNGEDAIVYDTATFSVVNSAEYSGGTSWFALNGDGSVGVAGFYGGMTRYNMSTGLYLDASDLVVGSSNNWSDGEFSPDGSLFVCRSNKGIHVFETDGWTALLNAYGAGAKTARFSPDGTKLLISSVNNQNNFRMTVLETSGWTVVAGYGSNTAQCSDGEWLDNDNFVIRYNNVTNVCNLSGGVITLSPVTEPAAAEQGNFECLKASPGNGLFVAVYNAASYVYNSAGVLQSYPNLENLDAARLDFNQ